MLRAGTAGYYFQRAEHLSLERPPARWCGVPSPSTSPLPENNPRYGPAWLELERLTAPRVIASSPERESFSTRVQALATDSLATAQARNRVLYAADDGHRALADHASAEMIAGIDTLDAAGTAFNDARARLTGVLTATNGTLAELGHRCGLDPAEVAWLIEPARAVSAEKLAAATPERDDGELAFDGSVAGAEQTGGDRVRDLEGTAMDLEFDIGTGWDDQPGVPASVGGGPANTEGPGL